MTWIDRPARHGWAHRRALRRLRRAYGTESIDMVLLGDPLTVLDIAGSIAVRVVAAEIGDGAYDFADIDFAPGDVVLDIGAHVGLVSMHLARRHPDITIYAFEPMPEVFRLLMENLRLNRITNVRAYNLAVTPDGGPIEMVAHLGSNTGGGTSSLTNLDLAGDRRIRAEGVRLDDIVSGLGLARSPLLKIDIEGAEHEVLAGCTTLGRFDHVRGEFHENGFLRSAGHSMAGLIARCEAVVGVGRVKVTECQMADT